MKNRINRDNLGTNYLKLFYWLAIVLIAILLNKGVETFVYSEKFREIKINLPKGISWYELVSLVDWNRILDFAFDFFVLFLLVLFSVRYIAWSPYKIFNNVEEFGEHGEALGSIYEERVIFEVNQSKLRECLFSFVVFTSEFFLAYLAVLSYENHPLLLIVLCILSGIDVLMVLLSALVFTASNTWRNLSNAFAGLRGETINPMTIKDRWRSISEAIEGYLIYMVPSLLDFAIMLGIFAAINFWNVIPVNGNHSILSGLLVSVGLATSIILSVIYHKHYYSNIFSILKASNSFERYEGIVPPAYLKKEAKFADMAFIVNPNCYIPTPETEGLLAEVTRFVHSLTPDQRNGLKILDVGTGCGNLAIALKSYFRNAAVTGTDISGRAIGVAHKNASKHNTVVKFIKCDLIKSPLLAEQPDLIVANLPWGDTDPGHILKSNSLYDYEFNPLVSLFPKKGLVGTYKDLMDQIIEKKWTSTLFFEAGTLSEAEIKNEIHEDPRYTLEYISVDIDDNDPETNNIYSIVKVVFNRDNA